MTLVFDTETNGLSKSWSAGMKDVKNWPRIVQLAWCVYDEKGRPVKSRQCIIKPDGWTIPAEVSEIHGISTEYAEQFGVPILEALRVFIADYEESDILVAHNIKFEYLVLGAEMIRAGIRAKKRIDRHICTMESSTNFCAIPAKSGYKWPKLVELHTKLFGVGFDGAHDAMIDVQACARCYYELLKQGIIND